LLPILATKSAVHKHGLPETKDDAALFTALRGLGYVYHVRANLRDATQLIDEALTLARRVDDPALLAEAYHLAGVSTFHLGGFQSARDWLQQSLEAGDNSGRRHSEVYGINLGVFCRA